MDKELDKVSFVKAASETLFGIVSELAKAPSLELAGLEKEETALVIVDMVNGFTREGMLQSPRVEQLIPAIVSLMEKFQGYPIVAFADNHTDASPEFHSYPAHCLVGSSESELVSELKDLGGYLYIPKNSTNGFLEEQFQTWLRENAQIKNFIVVGDCTDICILQFASTLKGHFNRQNLEARIIVPMNAVDTYDLGLHNGDLTHIMALYYLTSYGVEVVKEVKI